MTGENMGNAKLKDELTGALVGLARSTDNDTETDVEVCRALAGGLIMTADDSGADDKSIADMIEQVHDVKMRLVPGCANCESHCGRTDDYDMELLWNADEDIRSLKLLILAGIRDAALHVYDTLCSADIDDDIKAFFSRALMAVGSESDEDWLKGVAAQTGDMVRRCRAVSAE